MNHCLRSSYVGSESPQRLNNFLVKRIAQLTEMINLLEERGESKYLSIKQLKEKLVVSTINSSVYSFIEDLINNLVTSNRIETARSYIDSLDSLKNFINQKDLSIYELYLDVLKNT